MNDHKMINEHSDSTEGFAEKLKEYDFNNIDKAGIELIFLAIDSIDSLLNRLNEQVDRNTDLKLAFDKAFEYLKESHIERDSTVEVLRNETMIERKNLHGEIVELMKSNIEVSRERNDIINKANEQLNSLHMQKDTIENNLTAKWIKARKAAVNGGKYAPWKPHEQDILNVIDEYRSDTNKLKTLKDPTKLTQKNAINKISNLTGLKVVSSTFNNWLKRYDNNNGKVFS